LRKGAGIYYTPPYVVRYIVDQTLGKKLEELEAQHGLAAAHEARKLKVLDPACGSGSFLIYAFDVLAAFYERCNQRITTEKVRLLKDHDFGDVLGTQDKIKTLPPLLFKYYKIILEENLYGVDLDEEAAELAGVNLIMKAFDRVSSNGRKLPLILNQNIKVGNSLIGYLPGAKLWEKTSIAAKDTAANTLDRRRHDEAQAARRSGAANAARHGAAQCSAEGIFRRPRRQTTVPLAGRISRGFCARESRVRYRHRQSALHASPTTKRGC
jgi:hypothetical protein